MTLRHLHTVIGELLGQVPRDSEGNSQGKHRSYESSPPENWINPDFLITMSGVF